jgi:hypothetical protein
MLRNQVGVWPLAGSADGSFVTGTPSASLAGRSSTTIRDE